MLCLKSHITPIVAPFRRLRRAVVAVLCAVLLVLPGLVPASARAARSEGAIWIVICGENGPETVAFDAAGGAPVPMPFDCPDCDDCRLCAAMGGSAVLVDMAAPGFAPLPLHLSLTSSGADRHDNPAQFWPDNRGPPRGTQDVYPTEFPAVAALLPVERRAL